MRLHDGTANPQPHAHAARLGGKERLEHLLDLLSAQPDACVFHADQHTTQRMPLRLDVQVTRSVHHGTHRLHTVAHEIQQDLLYLDPIAQHVRDIVAEDGVQSDVLPACLRPYE